jgi:transcriptional regulator with XRE-family HTH domain
MQIADGHGAGETRSPGSGRGPRHVAASRTDFGMVNTPTMPTFELKRLEELHRKMGRELEQARQARGVDLEAIRVAVGFERGESIRAIERGVNFTRASRLRPWLSLLQVDADDFLDRYAELVAPEEGAFPLSQAIRDEQARQRAERTPPPPPKIPRDVVASQQAGLGAELWIRRAKKGLRRADVAGRAGVTRLRLLQIERGLLKHRPTASLLWALTDALGAGPIWPYELVKRYPAAVAPDRPGAVVAPIGPSRRSPTDAGTEETA